MIRNVGLRTVDRFRQETCSEVREPHTRPLHDNAPAFDAFKFGYHLGPGQSLYVVESDGDIRITPEKPADTERPGRRVEFLFHPDQPVHASRRDLLPREFRRQPRRAVEELTHSLV